MVADGTTQELAKVEIKTSLYHFLRNNSVYLPISQGKSQRPIANIMNVRRNVFAGTKTILHYYGFYGTTPLGKEVSNFLYHLERCSYSYTRLKNMIIENNIIVGKTEDPNEVERLVDRKLLSRGWNSVEIKHFRYIMRSAFRMETIYRNSIFNSILHRYYIIRDEHEVNEIADKIIQKMMMNQVQFLFALIADLQEISSRFNEHYFNPETSEYEDIPFVDIYDLILENIERYYHEESSLLNKSLSDTIEEVTLSLFLLLQPDEEDVHDSIEDLKDLGIRKTTTQEKMISRIKKEAPILPDSPSIEKLSTIKLRDIYLKYLEIKEK
jgi:hypothetical protein